MNKRQKEVLQSQLNAEKKILKQLEKQYTAALNDINNKIRILQSDELTQSRIYRIEHQKDLKSQVSGILEKLHSDEYSTIEQFLKDSYTSGFIGTAYDLFGQGVSLIMPIDPQDAVRAVMTDSKISGGLYSALGVDVKKLKKSISAEISRGLASDMSYEDITRNIANTTRAPLSRARTIVQTETHRIKQASTRDVQVKAKEKGADVLKQWNSTLDGETRKTHRKLDGQIREVEEPFEMDGKKAMYPGDFNDPAEDCNCRCESLTRARWALGEEELATLKERAEFFGLDKTKDFEDFKGKYLKAVEELQKTEVKFSPAKTLDEAEEYARKHFVVEKTWSGNGNVSFKGLSVTSANEMNETLADLFAVYDMPKLSNIQPMNFRASTWKGFETTPMAYKNSGDGAFFFNPKILKNQKTVDAYMQTGKEAFNKCIKNIDKFTGEQRELVELYAKAGRSLVSESGDTPAVAMLQHEIGHHIQNQILAKDKEAVQIVKDGFEKYGVQISGYACKTQGEYIAESFCAYKNGEADRIDPKLLEYFEGLKK